MAEEKAGFGEQALNKIAEVALARLLKDVEQIRVRVKTDLNRLARGEVDAIALMLQNLLLNQELRIERLHLQMGLVAVKPLSALRGKIQLVQPSEGSLDLTIDQDALTKAVNSPTFREQLYQRWAIQAQRIELGQVRCSFSPENLVVFRIADLNTATARLIISADQQTIELHLLRSQNQELPLEFLEAFMAQVSEAFNLREFAQRGMLLQIQRLQISAGKLTLQAAARIEKFPTA